MESPAVLSLGQQQQQHLAPFGELLPQQEGAAAAAASGPPWRGGGGREEEEEEEEGDTKTASSRSRAATTTPEPKEEGEEHRRELRRRLGRSFSLPASSSPSLTARLFSGHDEEEEEEEGAPSSGGRLGSCCTKCKKRVQFADALGLCLASVKHFSAADEPQVPPAVLSRLQSFPLGQKDLAHFSAALAGLGGSCASPFAGRPFGQQQLKPEPLWVASGPGRGGVDAEQRLRAQRVCLEEVAGTAVAGVPLDVRGVARVLSCPGPKEVVVRYTFNEWLSFLDAPAVALPPTHQVESSSSCPMERYQFSLCLPPGLPEGAAVHFALCYRSQQGEHWDNNGGANYTLRGGGSNSPEKPSSPFY